MSDRAARRRSIVWGRPLDCGDRTITSPHAPDCPGVDELPEIAMTNEGRTLVLPCPICGSRSRP